MNLLTTKYDIDDPIVAALAWSRMAEPGDLTAGTITTQLGVTEALRWLISEPLLSPLFTPARGGNNRTNVGEAPEKSPAKAVLHAAIDTWRMRLEDFDPMADIAASRSLGASLLTPSDPRWPAKLAVLGAAAPYLLWVLGDACFAQGDHQAVAVVGARAATSYGEQVATDLALGLAERGLSVASGGAYGIDAAAHRGALAAPGSTIAFMAGGIDRLYPPGNNALLRAVSQAQGCAVVSELPPGSVPYRSRFLARNRLIAAISDVTVVVEAAWRSGALSTARQAANYLRPVGAVPGPITSMASAGCHQLIRDSIAVCVTDVAEVIELTNQAALLEPKEGRAEPPLGTGNESGKARNAADKVKDRALLDGLPAETQHVYEALPFKRAITVESVLGVVAQPLYTVLSALAVLETRGLVVQNGNKWRRT